jgi:sulfur-oxidizing protein SoxA
MMRLSRAVRRAIPVAAAIATGIAFAAAGEIPAGERRSGFDFMSRETQEMQRDDTLNPGMLWVAEGEALWRRRDGAAGRACADCHGEASASMRGIAARYPAFDARERRPVDLQGRVNLCRVRHQGTPPLAFEGQELLALVAYVARQSRDAAIEPDDDERLAPFRERGRQFFTRQIGQLNFSCAQCHDDRWGERLGGSVIPQAHPTGYPIYRLEWQGLGSLQRRLRNCMTGVRAEPFAFGAQEYVDLELFLMARARGLAMESPAVRP